MTVEPFWDSYPRWIARVGYDLSIQPHIIVESAFGNRFWWSAWNLRQERCHKTYIYEVQF
jgi:hypothetical protein